MCGILGAVPSGDKIKFQNALNTLAHRGPDGDGVWQDGRCAMLGHRRLAILDVSAKAAQPMQYRDRFSIVLNGEIYNFLEIRKELEAKGHQFFSDSDTEVLLAAFAQWGEACVQRLNGMWAFAIWDCAEKKLFLSRDRMGKKPLYYIDGGDRFVFASEQKALLPYLDTVRPSEQFHRMCRNTYSCEVTGRTLFDGVKIFPAAHYGWLSGQTLRLTKYWSVWENRLSLPSDYQGQVVYLRELLLNSSRLRLRADVPIGTGLSGGVDSSAVAAGIAQAVHGAGVERLPDVWQNSFVMGFPGTVMDESHHARKVAEHLGIQHHQLDIGFEEYVPRMEELVYLMEDVGEVVPIPHIALYQGMRRHGTIVTLDGHGGDELFCGYESSPLHALPEVLKSMDVSAMEGVLQTYGGLHPPNEYFRGMTPPQILIYLLKAKIRSIRDYGFSSDWTQTRRFQSLNAHLHELTFSTVLPTLLRNYDRYSMISGVEIRMPLLDHRIVEFAFSIPWSSKVRNGYTKAVLRDAIQPWLPEEIVYRKDKIGFAPPIQDWMRGPLREYLLDEVASSAFKHSELINSDRLMHSVKEVIHGTRPLTLYESEQVWKQFNIYLWEKVFIQKCAWRHRSS